MGKMVGEQEKIRGGRGFEKYLLTVGEDENAGTGKEKDKDQAAPKGKKTTRALSPSY